MDFTGFEFLIQGSLLLVFPKDVVSRLFDRSGWDKRQRLFNIVGKVFSMVCLVMILLTPLQVNPNLFIAGLVLYGIGIIGLVVAMLNFWDTPPDQPVTRGFTRSPDTPRSSRYSSFFWGSV